MAARRSTPTGLAWFAVAFVACAILVVSVIPIPEATPEEGGGIRIDVLFHFVGYAALAAVLAVALRPRRLRYVSGGAFLGATVCGALVEFLQLGLSHRSFSVVDLAVNTAGAAAGTVIGTTIVLILGLLRRPE